MAPPTLAEKQVFYAGLAHLDALDDEPEDGDLGPDANLTRPAATPTSGSRKRKRSVTLADNEQLLPAPDKATEAHDRPTSSYSNPTAPRHVDTGPSAHAIASTPSQHVQPWQPPVEAAEVERPATSSRSRRQPARSRHSPGPSTHGRAPQSEAPPTLRRSQSEGTKKEGKAPSKKKGPIIPVEQQIFHDLCFFFIPNKDDHPVRKIRMQYAEAHGGLRATVFSEEVTHIIVDEKIAADSAVKELDDGEWPLKIPAVKINWLVESMNTKVLQNSASSRFWVEGRTKPIAQEAAAPSRTPTVLAAWPDTQNANDAPRQMVGNVDDAVQQGPPEIASSRDIDSDELSNTIQEVQKLGEIPLSFLDERDGGELYAECDTTGAAEPAENHGFQCMRKSLGDNKCANSRTIDVLQKMATCHDQVNDEWRTRAYRMAINALRKQPNLVQTREEALKLQGVGARIADKIEEIVASGSLRQLELTMSDPMLQLLRLFMGVYGAGRSQAHRWISQGHRSLEDLRLNAPLTPNQRIGVEHHDDFTQRIPRGEVEQHASIVRKAIREIDDDLELVVGGCYRRGQTDSGDIDILITKKSAGKELLRTLVLNVIVPKLMSSGFLKASLATGRSDEETSKWHGASALPNSPVWRRLDLLFVPGDEIGAALIYWTGNDIFNRSIRLLASRKGMRLNQHGLFKDVLRGKSREKVTEGELVESKSEKEIFRHLGVPWRPPEHRLC